MKNLSNLIMENELWLVNRTINYAKKHNDSRYTSTLQETWRILINNLSESLITVIKHFTEVPDLNCNDEYVHGPVASFGRLEAQKHRERGISMQMFLDLMKYYRQAYIDLISEAMLIDEKYYIIFINRCFDKIEIAFCIAWANEDKEVINDLRVTNRKLVNDITECKRAELEFNKQVHFFQQLGDVLPNPIFVKDSNGKFMDCNAAFEKCFNLSKKDIIGKDVYTLAPKELADKYFEMDQVLFRRGGVQSYESSVQFADGSIHDVIFNKAAFLNDDGNLGGLIGVILDITDRKRVERELEEREQQLLAVLGQAAVGIAYAEFNGKLVYSNQKFCDIVGYSAEELKNLTIADITHPDDINSNLEQHRSLLAGEVQSFTMEKRYRRKDGSDIWVNLNVSLVKTHSLEPKYFLGVVEDITQRKEAEMALVESEKRYRGLVENLPNMVFVCQEGEVVFANEMAVTGINLLNPALKQCIDRTEENIRQRLAGVPLDDYEIEVSNKEEQKLIVMVRRVPINYKNKPAILAVLTDITERKRLETAIAKSRDFYLSLFEEFPTLIWRAGVDGKCNYFNKSWLSFTGRSSEQELGDGWMQAVHPDDLDWCVKSRSDAVNLRTSFELKYQLRRYDGEYRWIMDIGQPFWNLEGNFAGYIGSCYDITEYKRAEELLKKYKLLSQQAHEFILFFKNDGTIIEANDFAIINYGYERHEFMSLKIHQLIAFEGKDLLEKQLSQAFEGGVLFETVHCRKDGSTFPVEMSMKGTSIGHEYVLLGIIRDITERKKAEESIQEQKEFTESLIQNSTIPTFVLDSQGKVIIWNKACEELSGILASEVIGTNEHWKAFYDEERPCLADLVVEERLDEVHRHYDIYSMSQVNVKGVHAEKWLKTAFEGQRYIVFDAAPITNQNGEAIAAIETLLDITDHKLAQQALMEKNQIMQDELVLAAKVQRDLLPTKLPDFPEIEVSWNSIPSIYVAGDMFNVFKLGDEHVWFYILDVMGHGVSAALRAVALNYLLKPISQTETNVSIKSFGQNFLNPSETLNLLNQRFTEDSDYINFSTVFLGILNVKSLVLTYARAGHCPPLVIKKNGEIRELSLGGPALGFAKNIKYKDHVVDLHQGDKVILYTDGITEAQNTEELPFTKEGLISYLDRNRNLKISELTAAVINEVINDVADLKPKDDLSILGIEIVE